MFAIGVGTRINKEELQNIANEPVDDFTYTVNNYEALMKLKDILAFKTCQGEKQKMNVTILALICNFWHGLIIM